MDFEEYSLETNLPRRKRSYYITGVSVFLLALLYFIFFKAPGNFPTGSLIAVEDGAGLRSISFDLKSNNIIRSRIVFEALSILYGSEKHLVSGEYYFASKESVFKVARRISKGDRGLIALKITIPEGFDLSEINSLFNSKLVNFDETLFLQEAKAKEGYLFPDTYFFFPTDREDDVIKAMSDNFKKKIAPLESSIIASGKTEEEIIIMASLIEKEAKGDADRGIISGILWKRIGLGMPLQVDAAPDTYKTKGLPDSPIANPGILAVKAAIAPVDSAYLYYLHDEKGVIHYAKSFEEHKVNKARYLK